MRKRVFGRQLARGTDTRRALFRALLSSLVEYGKITTTKAKAKAILPEIDRVVNLAKNKEVASQRRLFAFLGNDKVTAKRLGILSSELKDRKTGYVSMVNLTPRKGDGALMTRLEFIRDIKETKKEKKAVVKATK